MYSLPSPKILHGGFSQVNKFSKEMMEKCINIIEKGLDEKIKFKSGSNRHAGLEYRARLERESNQIFREIGNQFINRYGPFKRQLPNWYYEDELIQKATRRGSLTEMLQFLLNNCENEEQSKYIAEEYGIPKFKIITKSGPKKGRPASYYHILFIPDYNKMSKIVKLSAISCKKHIQRFCEISLLKKVGSMGHRKPAIYAAGYRTDYKALFFINSLDLRDEILIGLQDFRLNR